MFGKKEPVFGVFSDFFYFAVTWVQPAQFPYAGLAGEGCPGTAAKSSPPVQVWRRGN